VDIENTSIEGLEDLLGLETSGSIETYVHHNEAGDTIFHPKVYLFLNDRVGRLIVGSNNLTEAGLFRNTEAGMQIDARLTDPMIEDARIALAAWRDPETELAQRLDESFLHDLVERGYVFPERRLKARRDRSVDGRNARRRPGQPALFKAESYRAPRLKRPQMPPFQVPGTVLLMRVRRASELARRTQIQIPFRVVRTSFFEGVSSLVSAHDGRVHTLVEASARGGPNTIKAEVPEIETMVNPVLRLERTARQIYYRAFDADSVLGAPIRRALEAGFQMTPPRTESTILDLERATWWRFI
jgi:hypothetical protein